VIKRSRFAVVMLVGLMILIPMTVFTADDDETAGSKGINLIAGQQYDAGDIQVWNDVDHLYVKYIAQNGWFITETHLHVADTLDGIPAENGAPIPEQFDHIGEHCCVSEVLYQIPLEWGVGDELYIAAHSVVRGSEELPEMARMTLLYPDEGDPSHFAITVMDDPIGGEYLGWCVDIDLSISQNTNYEAMVYSTLGDYPEEIVNYPENFDLINWILNQDIIGMGSSGGYGNYTYGDVQVAIWRLLEDPSFENCSAFTSLDGGFDEDRVAEVIALATADGEGFLPDLGEEFAVILQPVDGNGDTVAQMIIIEFPGVCDCETAWGEGMDFACEDWATYLTYEVSETDDRS
jgi:hypothetical protein